MEEGSYLDLPFSLWRSTVLVSSVTFFNSLCFAIALSIWAINRQTQIRPSKSQSRPEGVKRDSSTNLSKKNVSFHRDSYNKLNGKEDEDDNNQNENGKVTDDSDLDSSKKLSSSDQDLFSHDWGRQKSRENLVRNFSMDFDIDDDDDDDDNDDDNGHDDNAPTFDDDSEEDNDDNELNTSSNSGAGSQSPLNPNLRTMKKDMLRFVSKMNIFSYLSDDAFRECLKHMRYIDLPHSGSAIKCDDNGSDNDVPDLDNSELDGSLYIVISGSVDCSCQLEDGRVSELNDSNFDVSSSHHHKLQLTVGPGDLVTSQLAMISDLVGLYQKQHGNSIDTPLSNMHPVHVSARTSTPNTRLICVPSIAFLSILQKFPHEVHQLTQTILGRTQRVTMQTLVKNLGLTNEIITRTHRATKERMMMHESNDNDLKDYLDLCQKECRDVYNIDDRIFDDSKITPLQIQKKIKYFAATGAASQLGTSTNKDVEFVDKNSSVIAVERGATIVQAGKKSEFIYFVIDGEIEVGNFITSISDQGLKKSFTRPVGVATNDNTTKLDDDDDEETASFQVSQNMNGGAIVGRMAVFTGEVSMVSARVSPKGPAYLLQISKSAYLSLINRNAKVLIQSLGSILRDDFSPVIHLLDWGLKWRDVQAGSMLALKGEACESLWVVLNGRLRSGIKHEGDAVTKHEHGRGACIGDIQVLTGDTWPHDVYAIRNSELAELPLRVLEFIMHMFPTCGVHFARVIANQVQQRYMKKDKYGATQNENGMPSYKLSVATIAIIPVCFGSNHDDASSFCQEIVSSLGKIAPCALMTKALAKKKLGKINNVKNIVHALKLSRLLGDLEENNRLVIYQGESSFNWWTKTCIQQADCVLLVVNSQEVPQAHRLERFLSQTQNGGLTKRVEMIILSQDTQSDQDDYNEVKPMSRGLNDWIDKLPFNTDTHLIRVAENNMKTANKNDISRMCRRITGCSLGLALGGGGARGIAHLGVIKALLDSGVQVDIVGGTSQGAFIGALYAKYPDDFDKLLSSARIMADGMASMREKVLDLTLPLVSYFDGSRFNRCIEDLIGEQTRIEDLVINFFCISTDLRNYCQAVHQKGLCWKYVRASMSLHGYLPPICEDGSLLLDGGYMCIVPNDVMSKQIGARMVIAVDVSREDMPDYYEYGSSLSGFWLLWNSWNPFVKTVRVPSMGELSQKLIWVNSSKQNFTIADNCDLFLSPPVHEYGTLDYHLFDEIFEHGYNHTLPRIEAFLRDPENQWIKK